MNGSHDRARRPARPAHPPFTAFPIAAYVFAAAFDTASVIGGVRALLGRAVMACRHVRPDRRPRDVPAGHGHRVPGPDPVRGPLAGRHRAEHDLGPVRPTVAAHVVVMAATFMIGSGDLAWRLSEPGTRAARRWARRPCRWPPRPWRARAGSSAAKLVFRHGIGVTGGAALALGGGANGAGPNPSCRNRPPGMIMSGERRMPGTRGRRGRAAMLPRTAASDPADLGIGNGAALAERKVRGTWRAWRIPS